MSRANDDTQVDYSLLDDAQLGGAVAAKVLGASHIRDGDYWELPGESFSTDELVSWWGAGLVIDSMAEHGWVLDLATENADCRAMAMFIGPDERAYAEASHAIRAILIAALRAKEAE